MGQLSVLEYSLDELQRAVVSIGDAEMETVSNCAPWTVRRLASHALNNQLFWGGVITGEQPVSFEETMGAAPYDGDLSQYAADVVVRALEMWNTEGVLAQTHVTPLGELPGSVVINFATIDALAHAWDISASLGRAIEFSPEDLPAIAAIVDATCTDAARDHGLIQAVTVAPDDANETERLMTLAGRAIPR